MKRIKFVGLDVHAETIAVAVAEQDGEIRSLGMIPNREESVGKRPRKMNCARGIGSVNFCCGRVGGRRWGNVLDGEVPGMSEARCALCRESARSHAAGLPARSGAHGSTD